jgi:hypothetical protein
MTVITETRYTGVYEGGPWAAFDVREPSFVPSDAFGGDPVAVDWWSAPTVLVGVGDSPDEALDYLRFLTARDATNNESGYFVPGERVHVASCTPDSWYARGEGVIRSVEFRPQRPYAGGPRGHCVYEVDFNDQDGLLVPERYLRRGPTSAT